MLLQASLSREVDCEARRKEFSWHKVIKFYTTRILPQSPTAPAPPREEPLNNIILEKHLIHHLRGPPSPTGEGLAKIKL